MKKLLAGGATLALAVTGAAAFAGPTGAQDFPQVPGDEPGTFVPLIEASASPETVAPGGQLTISSVDNCVAEDGFTLASLEIGVWPAAVAESEDLDESNVAFSGFIPSAALVDLAAEVGVGVDELGDDVVPGSFNADGSFEAQLSAPMTPGEYYFYGDCWQVEDAYFDLAAVEAEWDAYFDCLAGAGDEDEHADHDAEEGDEEEDAEEVEPLHADHDDEAEEEDEEEVVEEEEVEEEVVEEEDCEMPSFEDDEEFAAQANEIFVTSFTVSGAPAVGGTPILTG
jgi:hypothetical protein